MNTAAFKQNSEIKLKIIKNNYKSREFINYKAWKIKIKYEWNSDNKIFLYFNVR